MKNLITVIVLIALGLQACKESAVNSLNPILKSQSDAKALAAGAWTRKADRPGFAGSFNGMQFSINGLVYMGYGGHGGGHDLTFWEYNPSTDTWTQKANKVGGSYSEMASFSIGNKGYTATGGQGDANYDFSDELNEYDPAINVWTPKAKFPGGERRQAIGFSIGNKGYVGAGYFLDRDPEDGQPETYFRDLWEYNPESDCWIRKANIPGGLISAEFGLGKFGYVNIAGESPAFWQFNPASNQWIRKADFPGLGRANAVGFAVGNKGYFGTGDRNGEYLKDFWEYNLETDQWLQQADFAGGVTTSAFGVGTKSKGYIKTGNADDEPFLDHSDFWEFDPSVTD